MRHGTRTDLIDGYLDAKEYVTQAGYGAELDWQQHRDLSSVEERDFLRELAWVVLGCGMSERVVRARFPGVTTAFCDWRSAAAIVGRRERCREEALAVFGHAGKVESILTAASIVPRGRLRAGPSSGCTAWRGVPPVFSLCRSRYVFSFGEEPGSRRGQARSTPGTCGSVSWLRDAC